MLSVKMISRTRIGFLHPVRRRRPERGLRQRAAARAVRIDHHADVCGDRPAAQRHRGDHRPGHRAGRHTTAAAARSSRLRRRLARFSRSKRKRTANGRVIVRFAAGNSSGTATITAASGGSNVGATGAIKIAVGTAAVGRVSVNANPASVPAVGGTTTITATVFDINGNALSSAPVSFSTTAGACLHQSWRPTRMAWPATTLTTSQQATVTASVGAQAPATPPPTRRRHDNPAGVIGTGVGHGRRDRFRCPDAGHHGADDADQRRPSCHLHVRRPRRLPAAVSFATSRSTGAMAQSRILARSPGGARDTLLSIGRHVVISGCTDSFGNVVTVSTSVVVNPTVLTLTITAPTTTPSAGLTANFTIGVGTRRRETR